MAVNNKHIRKEDLNKPFLKFKTPKLIGNYCRNKDGVYVNDDSEKRYLHLGQYADQLDQRLTVPINLQLDKSKYVPFQDKASFLHWIRDHKTEVWDEATKRLKADFITDAHGLQGILLAPYITFFRSIEFGIYKLKGTYYLMEPGYNYENISEKPSSEDKSNSSVGDLDEFEKSLGYSGHKFEQCLTSDKNGAPHADDAQVNSSNRYFHVLETTIGSSKILYGATIDCLEAIKEPGSDTITDGEPVELASLKGSLSDVESFRFKRNKLLNIWAKAFVRGIEKTICGLRNDDFMVEELKLFHTSSLSREAKKECTPDLWSPNVCGNFAENFFTFIKASNLEEQRFYTITYDNENRLEITVPRLPVLPDWYCQLFRE